MTAALEPSTIKALQALWVSLPVRAPSDGLPGDGDGDKDPRKRQMQILDAYCFALSEFSSDAIWNTVNALRAGKIEEASKNFCPKAPELAAFVRSEQKRLDILKAPRAIPYSSDTKPFIDRRITQRVRTEELARDGFRCVATGISLDEFVSRGKRKTLSAGTIFFWAIEEAWSPSA